MSQYVVVFIFASRCVDVDTCQQTTKQKQLELLRTKAMK